MGGSSRPPEPTAEENALTATQTELLQQQQRILTEQHNVTSMLAPVLFEQMGIRALTDADGNITGFEQFETEEQARQNQLLDQQFELMQTQGELAEMTLADLMEQRELDEPLDEARRRIEMQLLDRQEQALAGELPISPLLQRQLATDEETLRETLRRQLGEGFETSSAGIEALASFDQRRAEILDQASRGELTTAAALATNMSGVRSGNVSQTANLSQIFPQFQDNRSGSMISGASAIAGLTGSTGGQFGTLAQMFGDARAPFTSQRMLEWQANQQNSAQNQQTGAGILTAAMMAAAMSSSREWKENIEDADPQEMVEALEAMRVTEFDYLPGWGEGHHIGMIAEEMPAKFLVKDGKAVSLYSLIGMLVSVLQSTRGELEELRGEVHGYAG